MNLKLLFIEFGLIVLMACQFNAEKNSVLKLKPDDLYRKAQLRMLEEDPDQAIALLKQSFEAGWQTPMKIVTDSSFYELIDHPDYRSKIRLLLEEYAIEHKAMMTRKNQQGEPIIINGQIVDESDSALLKNVKAELVHTDKDGFYFREHTKWNPQLFAYLVTDDNGEFVIETIMPGAYKDEDGNYIPSHIHFTLKKDGYKIYASEFTFEDDSVFMAREHQEQIPVAKLTNTKRPKRYQVTIPMQRE